MGAHGGPGALAARPFPPPRDLLPPDTHHELAPFPPARPLRPFAPPPPTPTPTPTPTPRGTHSP
jgi:hypothetical protein